MGTKLGHPCVCRWPCNSFQNGTLEKSQKLVINRIDHVFLVIYVPASDPEQVITWTSAGTMMTKFWSHMGMALVPGGGGGGGG